MKEDELIPHAAPVNYPGKDIFFSNGPPDAILNLSFASWKQMQIAAE